MQLECADEELKCRITRIHYKYIVYDQKFLSWIESYSFGHSFSDGWNKYDTKKTVIITKALLLWIVLPISSQQFVLHQREGKKKNRKMENVTNFPLQSNSNINIKGVHKKKEKLWIVSQSDYIKVKHRERHIIVSSSSSLINSRLSFCCVFFCFFQLQTK